MRLRPTLDSIDRYHQLLEQAVFIVNGWPRISERPSYGKDGYPMDLRIEGNTATLTWVDEDSYEHFTFTRSHSFPAEMLEWTVEQLTTWKGEEEERLRLRDEEQRREYARKREADEREAYEALKRKYEK